MRLRSYGRCALAPLHFIAFGTPIFQNGKEKLANLVLKEACEAVIKAFFFLFESYATLGKINTAGRVFANDRYAWSSLPPRSRETVLSVFIR